MGDTKPNKGKGKNKNAVQSTDDATPAAPQTDEPKAQTDATEIVPTGDAIVVQPAPATKTPRVKKNATDVDIDLNDPESAMNWLNSFHSQCKAHPPRKGYDQHWNSEGFIHDGPARRLPNKGAVKMTVFLLKILAQRATENGDAEALAALNFCNAFGTNVKDILVEAKAAADLAAAEAIIAQHRAKANA